MTELLYYADAYLKEAKAKILEANGKSILLDRTIFFPQTSTEPGDFGKIGGMKIAGLKKEGNDIWHIFEKHPLFAVGNEVDCAIDWNKRYIAMKLHSALHLLAGVFETKFKERAVAGAVKSVGYAYIVFKHDIENEKIEQAIEEANKLGSIDIKTYFDEKRKGFRWCAVGNYPPIPCGGLHVKNTKEIGEIFLEKIESKQGKQMITIKL